MAGTAYAQPVEYFISKQEAAEYHKTRPAKVNKLHIIWDLLDGNPSLTNADLRVALNSRKLSPDLTLIGEVRRSINRLYGLPDKGLKPSKHRMPRKEFEKLFVRSQFEAASSNGRSATLNMATVTSNQPPKKTKGKRVQKVSVVPDAAVDAVSAKPHSPAQLAIDTLRALMRANGWFSMTIRADSATWERVSIDRGDV
ncbi:hypothetical protein CMI47_20165 [Candidatus Pacearchaeota archaeon]|nr:hypothetical protein [Candidatus Pacearchaeota archaeon]|tara:strand:- start:3289 stop:3882 length:594 start_codon:yes stop_codon:yes gene_type:complete